MKSILINKLIIWIAVKLRVSPLIAHLIIMVIVTIAFCLLNPLGFAFFKEKYAVVIWFSFCVFVVFITWITKGKYRMAWLSAEEWRNAKKIFDL